MKINLEDRLTAGSPAYQCRRKAADLWHIAAPMTALSLDVVFQAMSPRRTDFADLLGLDQTRARRPR